MQDKSVRVFLAVVLSTVTSVFLIVFTSVSSAQMGSPEILDGKAEVIGDAKPLLRVAKESWKKACEDWKAEVKSLNKENQVIALDCGAQACAPEGVSSVCKSTGTYKIKMKMQ